MSAITSASAVKRDASDQPSPAAAIDRLTVHRNGFGFIRLLLASLVIISHASEIRYGSGEYELITTIFGTYTLGYLAVCGFFIVSGYLIAGSYLKEPTPAAYFKKRFARIYPAFIASSLICIFVVVPLGGGTLPNSSSAAIQASLRLVVLRPPLDMGAFAGTFYPAVNGVIWSIAAEFRCYLLVAALGLSGLLIRRKLITSLSALLFVAVIFVPDDIWHVLDSSKSWTLLFGPPSLMTQLVGLFLSGTSFYLWRDEIAFNSINCLVAVAGLLFCLAFRALAIVGMGTCGAYLIFAFAARSRSGLFNRINNKNDISYGVYLYAWPICKLLIFYLPSLSLLQNGILTFAMACLCGWLSWHLVEKPVMEALRRGDSTARGSVVLPVVHESPVHAVR